MTGTQRATLVQAVLEGIRLPATKSDLFAYAREQEPDVTADLEGLPDIEFSRLDDVGAALRRPPSHEEEAAPAPRAESGEPPGGDDYTTPNPQDTGRVRQAAERQKKQAET